MDKNLPVAHPLLTLTSMRILDKYTLSSLRCIILSLVKRTFFSGTRCSLLPNADQEKNAKSRQKVPLPSGRHVSFIKQLESLIIVIPWSRHLLKLRRNEHYSAA